MVAMASVAIFQTAAKYVLVPQGPRRYLDRWFDLLTNVPQNHLKPIFHCDAKPFALGPCVGLDPNATILHWGYKHVGI